MFILLNKKCWARLISLALFSIVFLNQNSAQNIFSNESFEKVDSNFKSECTISIGYNDALADWRALNTVDFAHTSKSFTIRSGLEKIQPYSGQGMAGFYLADMGDGGLPEYLYQKLSHPLVSGAKYRINLQIHFRNLDRYILNNFQIKAVSENPCGRDIMALEGEIFTIPIEPAKANSSGWETLSLEFTPKIDASYLALGLFEPKPSTKKKRNEGTYNGVYVFIDNVELESLTKDLTIITAPIVIGEPGSMVTTPTEQVFPDTQMDIALDKIAGYQAIPSVSFDHNSAEISPVFKRIFTPLIPRLIKKGCPIILEGHADNTGPEAANIELARRRAQAVADFFVANGFPLDKIRINVYGSSRPITTGSDELSLGINRRVEISQKCE